MMSRDDSNCRDFINHNCGCWCNRSCPPRPSSPRPCCCHCIGPTGPQGEMGPVGPRGEAGPAGSRGEMGPIGPRGETGPSGPQGEVGATGLKGEMGATGAQGEVGATGAQGEVGATGAQGETGATGPQGERGPAAATIPFSISGSMMGSTIGIASDAEGKPSIVVFAGFGNAYSGDIVQLQPGEWDAGTITIRQDISYPSSFMMPYNGTLQNIYVLFANRQPLYIPEGVTMRPFICIAVSDGSSLVFRILENAIAYTEPYVGSDEELPKYSLRRGTLRDLNIPLDEGTLVAIVTGWIGEGVSPEQYASISISGGLFID